MSSPKAQREMVWAAFVWGILLMLALSLMCDYAKAQPAPVDEFPHPMLGSGLKGNGYPLIVGGRYGQLNQPLIDKVARFDLVILHSFMVTPCRPDVMMALRKANPRIKLLAYWLYGDIWPVPDSDTTLAAVWWRYLRDNDGLLYRTDGTPVPTPGGMVNLAKRDSNGGWPVADSLFGLIRDRIIAPHLWDGVFLDLFNTSISWIGVSTIDYKRAGYNDWVGLDAAYRQAGDRIAHKLREFAGDDFILVANGVDRARYETFNGSMREKFPNQSGGTWHTNIAAEPRSYLVDDRFYFGAYNIIMSGSPPAPINPYTADYCRIARWGLGSVSLGDGWAGIGTEEMMTLDRPTYLEWWYDEYSVNPTTAEADTTGLYKHWLGRALGPGYRVPPPYRHWRRDFERGIVLVNPDNWDQPVTLERPYRRIKGVRDTLVNNGAVGATHTLKARDALFLLR